MSLVQQDRTALVQRRLELCLTKEARGYAARKGLLNGIGLIAEVIDLCDVDIASALRILDTANNTLRAQGEQPLSADQIDGIMLELTEAQLQALKQAFINSGLPIRE